MNIEKVVKDVLRDNLSDIYWMTWDSLFPYDYELYVYVYYDFADGRKHNTRNSFQKGKIYIMSSENND